MKTDQMAEARAPLMGNEQSQHRGKPWMLSTAAALALFALVSVAFLAAPAQQSKVGNKVLVAEPEVESTTMFYDTAKALQQTRYEVSIESGNLTEPEVRELMDHFFKDKDLSALKAELLEHFLPEACVVVVGAPWPSNLPGVNSQDGREEFCGHAVLRQAMAGSTLHETPVGNAITVDGNEIKYTACEDGDHLGHHYHTSNEEHTFVVKRNSRLYIERMVLDNFKEGC